jgi:hypothetical protein
LRPRFSFGALSVLMLRFNAVIKSTTLSPLGRGLCAMVLPWRFALMQVGA